MSVILLSNKLVIQITNQRTMTAHCHPTLTAPRYQQHVTVLNSRVVLFDYFRLRVNYRVDKLTYNRFLVKFQSTDW